MPAPNTSLPQGLLPARNDKKAPTFKGKNVDEFIETLEELAKSCNVPDSELPKAVRRYASKKVQRTLVAEKVFDGTDWKAATDKLQLIYDSLNDKYETSPRRLRNFAADKRADDFVTSREALDIYYRQFLQYAGTMSADGRITEQERDNLFFSGLPKKLCHTILPELMVGVKTRASKDMSSENPPSMMETLSASRTYFAAIDLNSRSTFRSSSRLSDSSASSDSDSDSDSSTSSTSSDDSSRHRSSKAKKRKAEKRKKTRKSRERTKSESDSEGAVLRKKVIQLEQKLKLLEVSDRPDRPASSMAHQPPFQYPYPPYVAPQNSYGPPGAGQYPPVYHPQQASTNFGNAYGAAKRCWMCGQSEGAGLNHPIGMRNCPETHKLIQEQLIAYNPLNGRLCRASDGAELPPWHAAPNGIAALLREELAKSSRPQRDAPPHQSAHIHSIGVLCDGEPVFSYDQSSDAHAFHSLPVSTRSQTSRPSPTGKTVRFSEDADDADDAETDDVPVPAVVPAPPPRAPVVPPPRINTEAGWKDSKHERARSDSFSKSKMAARPYRFTSDVQDSVSINAIEDHLLLTKVSITLRELLGVAPSLQKRFASLVKTRREPDTKDTGGVRTAALADFETAFVTADVPPEDTSLEASVVFDRTETSLTELLDRYAASLALGCPRTFAMVSGLVKGAFGDQPITFLIDTGSELNLVFYEVWDRARLPMNEDGARWSLKGLGGQPVPLLGCAVDAQVQVGGRNFDHHFFVSSAPGNGIYGGILGQPWLAYFSANIQYERNGETVLTVFPSGDSKKGGGVSITVCKKNHPRNALVLTSTVDPPSDAAAGFSEQARSLGV